MFACSACGSFDTVSSFCEDACSVFECCVRTACNDMQDMHCKSLSKTLRYFVNLGTMYKPGPVPYSCYRKADRKAM